MVEIKRLGSGDENRARDIVEAFYADGAFNEDFLSNESNYLLAAYADGEFAGFLYAYELARLERSEPMMFLYSIDVLSEYRRKGVGKKLVEALRAVCAERGFMKMFVITGESNEAAVNLYESVGGNRRADDDAVFVWESND